MWAVWVIALLRFSSKLWQIITSCLLIIFYYLPANLGKKQKDDRSLLTNNYFCTLKYKIMKGILPVYCRTMGYVVLLLSVFVPLLMFMFGMINDSNLLFTKASIKLLIWFSLFMIFLAKSEG